MSGSSNGPDENAGSSDLWSERGEGSGPESDAPRAAYSDDVPAGPDDVTPANAGGRQPFPGEAEAGTTNTSPPELAGPQVPSAPPPTVTPPGPGPQAPPRSQIPLPPQSPHPRSGDVPSAPPAGDTPRLERSRRDRWIGGVLGGLAAYFGVDPTLVRIVVIVLLFATGFVPVVVAYVVALVVMPEAKPGTEQRRRAQTSSEDTPRFILGGLLVAVGAFMLLNTVLPGWIRGDIIAPLALIAIGLAVVVAGARR